MMNWLRNVLGMNHTNSEPEAVPAAPAAPAAPMDPVLDTREFSQVEVDNIRLEAEAVEAEAELQAAVEKHQETISGHDPELKKLARQLRQMNQEPAGEHPAQT